MPWESTDDSGSGGVPPGGDAQDRGGEADCLSWSCCVIQAWDNEGNTQVMGETSENTEDWTHGLCYKKKKIKRTWYIMIMGMNKSNKTKS